MLKKCIIMLFAVAMIFQEANIIGLAEEAENMIAYTAESSMIINEGNSNISALSDKNETTYAVLKCKDATCHQTKTAVTALFDESVITRVRVGFKNFVAWRNIKTVNAVLSNGSRQTVVVDKKPSGISYADFVFDSVTSDSVRIEFVDYYNEVHDYVGIAELEIYGTEKVEITDSDVREFVYYKDMEVIMDSGLAVTPDGMERSFTDLFDNIDETYVTYNTFKNAYFVMQFAYPTDLSKFSFRSITNGDWAVATEVTFEVYNSETKFRSNLKNPAPVPLPGKYKLAVTDEWQDVVFEESDLTKGVTHLIVRFPEIFKYVETSGWGGFVNARFYGVSHTELEPVSSMIDYKRVHNMELLAAMNIIEPPADGVYTEEWYSQPVTRLDVVKTMLRLSGEYEEAIKYTGRANFDDAPKSGETRNIMAYVYKYRSKYPFFGSGTFNADMHVTMSEMYSLLLCYLGHTFGDDFTEEAVRNYCYDIGIGAALYSPELTIKEMCITIDEIMGKTFKDSDLTVIEHLHNQGISNDRTTFDYYTRHVDDVALSNGEYDYENDEWMKLDPDGTFSFTKQENPKRVQNEQFLFNSAYHLRLITEGIKPYDDPSSLRSLLGPTLKETGVRGLRFPGGTPAHYYLIEGYDYGKTLWESIYVNELRADPNFVVGGNFCPREGLEDNYHADFWNWLDFCQEFNLTPYFQVNMYFYVDDETGKIMPTLPSRWTHNSNGTSKVLNDDTLFYDGKIRIKEGAEKLGKQIDEMLARGYRIQNWELGNEDYHWVNYKYLLSGADEEMTDNYYDIAAAYAKVIKSKIPEATIVYTDCGSDASEELKQRGVLELMDGPAFHYPYGAWNTPPKVENGNLKMLMYKNDMDNVRWASAEAARYEGYEYGDVVPANAVAKPASDVAITETAIYKFEAWNCYDIQDRFAMAINTIKNWGEGIFETPWKVMVMHELESAYFGWVKYDKFFEPGSRRTRTYSGSLFYEPTLKYDIPEAFNYSDKVFISSAARAMGLLADHIGGDVLQDERLSVGRHVCAYASENTEEGTIKITGANRMETEAEVKIKLSDWNIAEQDAEITVMSSDYLWTILPQEYDITNGTIKVNSNAEDANADVITFTAKPWSVFHITVKTK